jgi:aspartyl-tRNA(Asn)/glutamyl-tRNA(Gln) amidotransferase subunit C
MSDNSKHSQISQQDIKKILDLSLLDEEKEDVSSIAEQFNSVLDYFHKLLQIDTSNVEPLTHLHNTENIFRNDVPLEKHLSQEEGLKNSPDTSGTYIRVPLVIE